MEQDAPTAEAIAAREKKQEELEAQLKNATALESQIKSALSMMDEQMANLPKLDTEALLSKISDPSVKSDPAAMKEIMENLIKTTENDKVFQNFDPN
jgi:hypothetical protein